MTQLRVTSKVCAQCGREGVRGFATITTAPSGGPDTSPPIILCANTKACRKRWPKSRSDDE